MASVTAEQSITSNGFDHFPRISIRQWSHSEANVGQDFHGNPTKAQSNQRAEGRILGHSHHHLDTACYHGLNQDALHGARALISRQTVLNVLKSFTNGCLALEVQEDAAGFRLVDDL